MVILDVMMILHRSQHNDIQKKHHQKWWCSWGGSIKVLSHKLVKKVLTIWIKLNLILVNYS